MEATIAISVTEDRGGESTLLVERELPDLCPEGLRQRANLMASLVLAVSKEADFFDPEGDESSAKIIVGEGSKLTIDLGEGVHSDEAQSLPQQLALATLETLLEEKRSSAEEVS